MYQGTVDDTEVNTGLSINGSYNGKTYMLIASTQWDAGDNTSSGVYMIRCGYNGNNYSITAIKEDNINSTHKLIISVNTNGRIVLRTNSGASTVLIFSSKN